MKMSDNLSVVFPGTLLIILTICCSISITTALLTKAPPTCKPDMSCVSSTSKETLERVLNSTKSLHLEVSQLHIDIEEQGSKEMESLHSHNSKIALELIKQYLEEIRQTPELSCILSSYCWEILFKSAEKLILKQTGAGVQKFAKRPKKWKKWLKKAEKVVGNIFKSVNCAKCEKFCGVSEICFNKCTKNNQKCK